MRTLCFACTRGCMAPNSIRVWDCCRAGYLNLRRCCFFIVILILFRMPTTLRCIMLTIAHRILTLVLCIAGALANVSELQGRLEHAESALKRSLSVPAGQHTTSSPRTLLDVSPGGSRVDSFPASSTPVVMGRRETSSLRQPRR